MGNAVRDKDHGPQGRHARRAGNRPAHNLALLLRTFLLLVLTARLPLTAPLLGAPPFHPGEPFGYEQEPVPRPSDPAVPPDAPASAKGLPVQPVLPGYQWTDALGSLRFREPVVITAPPGETNRLFIAERTGVIRVVTNLANPSASVFLDLRDGLYASYLEAGLLGLAFHPNYAVNRQFFVFRTALGERGDGTPILLNVLARFEASADDPNRADPISEVPLIAQEDWHDTHNAGDLKFGPDGYLYLSLGDEGSPPDQFDGARQPLDVFFGGILRIDVDQRMGNLPPNPHPAVVGPYSVPADNPFVGLREYAGEPVDPTRVRTEFLAIGFRNPWRIAFDPVSGELLAGEVGGARWEELNIVRPGANYGWPYREAHADGIHWFLAPPGLEFEPPLHAYPHGSATFAGNSVVAGVFHHGPTLPELAGTHVFADCRSGHTWALRRGGDGPSAEWLCTEPGLVTFGTDPRDGSILAANFATGSIRRLVRIEATADPEATPPATLAETGVFTDLENLTPTPGLHPYSINAPFWSDKAWKQRWVAVPPGQPPTIRADGLFDAPAGTVWVKHFELELVKGDPASRRRLETRLLIRSADGTYGLTYRWGDSRTNAVLVPQEGMDETFLIQTADGMRSQVWHYPGRAECSRCHTAEAGHALAFSAEQLNRFVEQDGISVSQIEVLRAAGQVPPDLPPASTLPALADPHDPSRPLAERVRSYLHSNCSSCHRPGLLRETTARWDARFTTPFEDMGLLDGRLVIPGRPDASRLLSVVARTAVDLVMPPLASNLHDEAAIGLLHQWIQSIPGSPWTQSGVGEPAGWGSATVEEDRFVLGGNGIGWQGDREGIHALERPFQGDGFLQARLLGLSSASPEGLAGMMVRSIAGSGTPFDLAIALDPSGRIRVRERAADGVVHITDGPLVETPVRFRLTRVRDEVRAEAIASGVTAWFTRLPCPPDLVLNAGFFVAAGPVPHPAQAVFYDIQSAALRWTSPTAIPLPGRDLTLALDVKTQGVRVTRVGFAVDGRAAGTRAGPPYAVTWPGKDGAPRVATGRVMFDDGSVLDATPHAFTERHRDASAAFVLEDRDSLGAWMPRYGADGALLPPDEAHHASGIVPVIVTAETWAEPADPWDPRAPVRPGSSLPSAATWQGNPGMEIDLPAEEGVWRRVTLYFVDWDGAGARTQWVDVFDRAGRLLDRRPVSAFTGGAYLGWQVQGPARLVITPEGVYPALLSGIFLDPPLAFEGHVAMAEPAPESQWTSPGPVPLRAVPVDPASPPLRVDFLANGTVVGTSDGPAFAHAWEPPRGEHRITARAWDRTGQFHDTPAVRITVAPPATEVAFLGTDGDTQGDWPRRLGSSGLVLASGLSQLAPGIRVTLREGRVHSWSLGQELAILPDRRAPWSLDGLREVGCWTSAEAVVLDVELDAARPHIMSLHAVDWDTNLRRQRVQLIHPESGEILEEQTLRRFFHGTHLTYRVRGNLQIRIVPETVNAVLSGIYFDPAATTPVPLPFPALSMGGGMTALRWTASPGMAFRVAGTPGLGFPWTTFPQVLRSGDGMFGFTDPDPAGGGDDNRFYRLELLTPGNGPLTLPPPPP